MDLNFYGMIQQYKDEKDLYKMFLVILRLYVEYFGNPQDLNLQKFFREQTINISQNTIIKNNGNKTISGFFSYNKGLGPKGKIGIPYIFKYREIPFIVKNSPGITLDVHTSLPTTDNKKRKCQKSFEKKGSCIPGKLDEIEYYVKSSEYINETIIGMLLNQIFYPSYFESRNNDNMDMNQLLNGFPKDRRDLANSVFQLGFFQTNDGKMGFNAMEIANGTLDKLFSADWDKKIKLEMAGKNIEDKNKKIGMIFQQVFKLLMILKKDYDFNHGDLKAGNMFYKISDEYMNVEYPLSFSENSSGLYCKTNIRIKIADYGKSSITYNGIRYYCEDKHKLELLGLFDYSKIKDDKFVLPSSISDQIYIGKLNYNLRHRSCPFILATDVYCFIVSMMIQIPEVCAYLHSEIGGTSITQKIFGEGVFDQCIFIRGNNKSESVVTAFKKLKDVTMRCDILDIVNDLSLKFMKS